MTQTHYNYYEIKAPSRLKNIIRGKTELVDTDRRWRQP